MKKVLLLFIVFSCCFTAASFAQQKDSVAKKAADTLVVKKVPLKFEPRKATIRSAILPGWGQLYNKKYWKAPLVWGGLGITAGTFFYNKNYYTKLKSAYINLNDGNDLNNGEIDPEFRNLSANAVLSYRNSFRQNVDYSVLFFILFWGLNVVDATVDAHLKAFDVSDDLSLQIKPGFSQVANTSGISLVLNIGKNNKAK